MGGGAREIHCIEIPLVHVQQQLSWDCGVSAVMMVLNKEDRLYMQNNLDIVSKEEGFNKSTWTIDLAYLLQRFGVKNLYATVTLGVNPGYTQEDFYLEVLKKDAQRIKERFYSAEKHGLKVEKRSVEMDEILDHLSCGNPAIVLVNANLLICDTCYSKKCLMQILNCCTSNLSYQGHYIVLCGFDKKDSKIWYRNPSVLNKVCSMPFDSFESARKSFGTDEDVLFVYFDS